MPRDRLASAYGLFKLACGVAWFAGGAVMGILYDASVPALVVVSVTVELLAVPLLFAIRDTRRRLPADRAAA